MVKAQLDHAVLIDADLRNVDLTGANLSEADVTGADFTGALLSNVTWVDRRRCRLGSVGTCD
jgi:uncharacterized protein YjbI with pentapeptide repeats